jgi:hypothetical protein
MGADRSSFSKITGENPHLAESQFPDFFRFHVKMTATLSNHSAKQVGDQVCRGNLTSPITNLPMDSPHSNSEPLAFHERIRAATTAKNKAGEPAPTTNQDFILAKNWRNECGRAVNLV